MPSIDVVHAIYELTQGATMLKAGRMGRPHFRQFKLLEDLTKLQWESPKKDKGESVVAISQIQGLKRGQKTKVFEGNPIPEYESLSFSLLYKQGNVLRSLDIVCKDRTEFDVWTVGIEALINGFSDAEAVKLAGEALGQTRVDGAEKLSDRSFMERLLAPSVMSFFSSGSPSYLKLEFGLVGERVSVREDACDIYTWGSSPKGTLGHGEEAEECVPRVVEALLGRDIRMIACGAEHTLAVSVSGEVFSWGSGRGGKLGLGHIQDRYTPLKIGTLADKEITWIACHELHSAAATGGGELFTWGRSGPCLGYKTADRKQTTPKLVEALSPYSIKAVACGLKFTLALTSDGKVFSFGENDYGQLGLGEASTNMEPSLISALTNHTIVEIACGAFHVAVVTAEGEMFTWGANDYGQLATGDLTSWKTPFHVPSSYWNEKISNVSCGDKHTAVLSTSGTVYCFGDGRHGQLGVRLAPETPYLTTPCSVPMTLSTKILQVDCGSAHTAAVSENGRLFTWGKGGCGRLGHNDHVDRHIPTEVEATIYKQVKTVSCGGRHMGACIIRTWVHDQETKSCMACKVKFTTVRRRHHCRKCGGIFCATCSSKRFPILEIGYSDPVRVCDRCYHTLSESKS